ncbi:MAG TPA: MFS transporter [Candidatus Margulisiibacteriota bacterium]|nr:MFS transporter [Candidatus Margulisiibacteriota bacterium]
MLARTDDTAPAPPPSVPPTGERVSLGIKLAYGVPNLAGAAMLVPILIHMPKFYADVVVVPMGYLAIAIAFARAIDALSDPFIGWLSDRTHSRWGRRRPYMAAGAPLCALAFFALFTPPTMLSQRQAALWFGATFILYSIFHTLYALPHYALGPELTLDYHERSRLFGVREAFTILGTIGAAVAPGVLVGVFHLSERRAFSALGMVMGVLLVVLYGVLVLVVRERPDFVARESNPFVPGVRRALRNRPFRILLLTYVVGSIAGAIPGTLMPFFNSYVIRPENEARWLAIFLATYFASGFLCLPIWVLLARRFGKRSTWLASFLMGITGGGAMFFLGQGDSIPLLLLIAWAGSSFGAGLFLGPAMQADVIDYDELHTGKRREAQYSAFWAMLPKFVAIPSAAIPIAILGSIGYVPNVVQTPQVVLAIKAIFALTPAFFSTLAFFIAWRFAIDEGAHRSILQGIAQHQRGEPAIDPLTGEVLAPPAARAVEERTSWFLDHFSRRELTRFLRRDRRSIVYDVWCAVAAAAGICVGAALLVANKVTSLEVDPGPVPVLAIVTAGFAFAVGVFHVLRLGAARQLAAGAVPVEVIRAHLDAWR